MTDPLISDFRPVELSTWPRADIFHFYRNYEDPFFHVTVPVKITGLKQNAPKGEGLFFLSYLHAALTALNQTEALRNRFTQEGLACYDIIHAGCTVMREDETFGFGFFPFAEDRAEFIASSLPRLKAQRNGKGLFPLDERPDVAFFSVLPWISFTSFKNAHHQSRDDGFPRVVFGKGYQQNGDWYLPVAVEVHHALVDGLHVGRFYERLEKQFLT